MQEKTLYLISVMVILLGLPFLFFYADEADLPSVARIDSELPEEKVRVSGRITRLSDHDKVIFLELQGERIETMEIVLFKEEEIFLHEGDYVEVSGTVEEYRGKKEVIADKVVLK